MPTGPQTSEPVTISRRRRRPAIITAGVMVLVLAVCGLVVRLVATPSTKVLTDGSGRVSIAVPRSWYDNTATAASSDDAPLLSASNLWQNRWVRVDAYKKNAGVTLASFHADGIQHECASWTCTTKSGSRALRIAEHDALEQVVTHPADADDGASTSLTLTVWTDDAAVELYAVATSDGATAPTPAQLERIASSLRIIS